MAEVVATRPKRRQRHRGRSRKATVLADGSVGVVHIVRSLDGSLGLDQNAIEAVRAWRFRPGTYLGKPVAVKVLIELSFNLR